jgi:hypothetical protein
MSALASKQQSLKIFDKLKTKAANKVWNDPAKNDLTSAWRLIIAFFL